MNKRLFGVITSIVVIALSIILCVHVHFKSYTVEGVPVTDIYYYKHLDASLTFRKQIQDLPPNLLKCIHTITITDYNYDQFSHILFKERDMYLIPEQKGIENVVLHEACHAFDSLHTISDSKEFEEALEADNYTMVGDKRETFVSLMQFYLKDPEGAEKFYPNFYKMMKRIEAGQ